MFARLEETLFQILFVMTESVGPPSSTAFFKTVLLFWIDLGQVLRILCSPRYGWSEDTYDLMKTVDAVWNLADLVSSVLPRYSLWIFAALLVIVAIGDTFYVAKVFKGGEKIKTMWPVKLLRFLVATTVTTLYSSVLKWLLIPIDCLVSSEESMSVVLHGNGAPCQPWRSPDFVFSVSTLCVAVVYIAFALTTSLLSIETNPLARGARCASTGRVEFFWIMCKVWQSFLMYFAVYIKPVTCAVVLLILAVANLYLHVTTLPFHHHNTNVLRGGVYGCVAWLSLSAVIVSTGERNQPREWLLVAFSPLFAILGGVAVHLFRRHLLTSMERLRIEHRQLQSSPLDRRASEGTASVCRSAKPDNGTAQTSQVDTFYDKTWERRRAFPSEARALVTIRTMLYQREKRDKELVLYLSNKACQEHPTSNQLKLLRLELVRFLFGNMGEASLMMKRFKLERLALHLDQRYVVYAIQRKTSQESLGQSLGKGTYSAINVMEFDSGMDRASKAHKDCLRALRKFWGCNERAARQRAEDDAQVKSQAREMMAALDALQKSVVVASQQYRSLLQLYPSSSALLHSYAAFYDTILYDQARAEHLRDQADTMDEEWDGGSNKSEGRAKPSPSDEGAQSSGGSSAVESFRGRMVKLLSRHSEKILAADYASVLRLAFRVRVSIVIIVLVTTAGFVLTSKFLLSDMATANIESIDQTQKFGVYATTVMFHLRSLLLAARRGDADAMAASRARCEELMDVMRDQHRLNYEAASGPVRDYFLDPALEMVVPSESGLRTMQVNFWDFGNEFARRAQRATLTTLEELMDESYVLGEISSEKRNIAFVFDNTLQHLIPNTERLLDLYEDEVIKIAHLTSLLVSVNVVVNSLLVLFISGILLIALRTTIPRLQPHLVLCRFSLELPKDLTHRLVVHYQQLEQQFLAVENEEEQMEQLLHSDGASLQSPTPKGRVLQRRLGQPPNDDGETDSDSVKRSDGPERQALTSTVLELHVRAPDTGLDSRSDIEAGDLDRITTWVGAERKRRLSVDQDEISLAMPKGGRELDALREVRTLQHVKSSRSDTMPQAHEATRAEGPSIVADDCLESTRLEPSTEESPMGDDPEVENETVLGDEEGQAQEEEAAGHWDVEPTRSAPDRSSPSVTDSQEQKLETALLNGGFQDEGCGDQEAVVLSCSERVMVMRSEGPERIEVTSSREATTLVASRPCPTGARHNRIANDASALAGGEVSDPKTPPKLKLNIDGAAGSGDGAGLVSPKGGSSLRWAGSPPALINGRGERPSKRLSVGWMDHDGSSILRSSPKPKTRTVLLEPLPTLATSGIGVVPTQQEEGVRMGVPEAWQRELRSQSARFRSWQNRTDISSLIMLLVLAMCVFSTIYPTRTLPDIRDMAPMIDYAGRRHYQLQVCAFLARELVLDDGFSRMTHQQLAGQLSSCSASLLETYDIVRLGHGDKEVKNRIKMGADERYKDHNDVMYTPGCPWREAESRGFSVDEDEHQGGGCELEVYPEAAQKGLHYLAMTFFEVLDSVLHDYGPPQSSWDFDRVKPSSAFDQIVVDDERVREIEESDDIAFVTEMMEGDLFLGLDHIHELFHHHTHHFLVTAQHQTELLYALYVILVVVVFYQLVFRGILSAAATDLATVRGFVAQMPLHILSPGEVHCVCSILVGEDEMRAADLHERAGTGAQA